MGKEGYRCAFQGGCEEGRQAMWKVEIFEPMIELGNEERDIACKDNEIYNIINRVLRCCGCLFVLDDQLRPQAVSIIYSITMNFLRFLSSGAGILNFSFSNPTVPGHSTLLPPLDHKLKEETQEAHSLSQQMAPQKTLEQLLIKQQQELLNECIKLNLELIGSSANKEQSNASEDQPLLRKRIKKVNKCEHTDKKHYAKGLCNNCYHRYGRNKKPWNCPHDVLYASGMCQNCYINRYNKMRRDQVQKLGQDEEMVPSVSGRDEVEEKEEDPQ